MVSQCKNNIAFSEKRYCALEGSPILLYHHDHSSFIPSLTVKKIMITYQLIATILLTMNCLRSRGFIASSVKKLYTAHVNGGRISTISRPVKQQSKSLLSQMRQMTNEANSKHKWANMLYRYDKKEILVSPQIV